MRDFILKLNEGLYAETERGNFMLKPNKELYAESE
jgi:hypothetical protein